MYVAARNPAKAQEAIQELKKETGKDAIFLQLDLADLKSVKDSAAEFTSKESQLHVLFNSGLSDHSNLSDRLTDNSG